MRWWLRVRGLLLLGALVLFACDANLGSIAEATGSDDSTAGDGDPSEEIPCIGGQLCPETRKCSNGLCLQECSGDSQCSASEYCGVDGLCHSPTVPTCNSDGDCAATQICRESICTTSAICDPYDYLADGCASNAVCVEDLDTEGEGNCFAMPACGPDGTCPIGLDGAVCNVDFVPSKDPICLIGLCDTVEHCPNLWSCVRYDNAVLGYCSDGGFASPCTIADHCLSGVCVPLPGLGGGICQ
jgi:hypothetical protein